MKIIRLEGQNFDFDLFYDCIEPADVFFYDCQQPVRQHRISDTGDISPVDRTEPCPHMLRTLNFRNILICQSNRYANWGLDALNVIEPMKHFAYSATCCLSCKDKYNRMAADMRYENWMQGVSQPRQPPIDAVDVTRQCPWTRWEFCCPSIFIKYDYGRLK